MLIELPRAFLSGAAAIDGLVSQVAYAQRPMPRGIDARLEVAKWRHCAPRARDNAQDSRGEGKRHPGAYMRNTHSPMLPSGPPNGIMESNLGVTPGSMSGKKREERGGKPQLQAES